MSAVDLIGYSVLDDAANCLRDTLSGAPYIVLILIAGVFVALCMFGLIKKMIVFTVVVALPTLVVIGLCVYAGHSVALT